MTGDLEVIKFAQTLTVNKETVVVLPVDINYVIMASRHRNYVN